jgi:hypothetical protein
MTVQRSVVGQDPGPVLFPGRQVETGHIDLEHDFFAQGHAVEQQLLAVEIHGIGKGDSRQRAGDDGDGEKAN